MSVYRPRSRFDIIATMSEQKSDQRVPADLMAIAAATRQKEWDRSVSVARQRLVWMLLSAGIDVTDVSAVEFRARPEFVAAVIERVPLASRLRLWFAPNGMESIVSTLLSDEELWPGFVELLS
jgi:hypothetical protein